LVENERAKVGAVHAEDSSHFEELVRSHEARVFRLALSITRNREDAEDATQRAFLKAFEHIGQFRGDSLFSTWLIRIATNEALQVLRRRREHVSLDEFPSAIEAWQDCGLRQPEPTPEQSCAQAELWGIMLKMLAKLDNKYKMVLVLRYLEFSAEDTAQLLRLSTSAVKARLLRARSQLRLALEPCIAAKACYRLGRK